MVYYRDRLLDTYLICNFDLNRFLSCVFYKQIPELNKGQNETGNNTVIDRNRNHQKQQSKFEFCNNSDNIDPFKIIWIIYSQI